MGVVRVVNKHIDKAKRRSGKNVALIHTMERGEDSKLVHLPRSTKLKDAYATSSKLGALSLGVVRTRYAHAIRVSCDEAVTAAKSALDPKLAEFIGERLLELPDDHGKSYVVKGVEAHASLLDIGNALYDAMGWWTRPERFVKSNTRNRNNVVVFTDKQPKQTCLRCGAGNEWLQIVDFVQAKRYNPWAKAFEKTKD